MAPSIHHYKLHSSHHKGSLQNMGRMRKENKYSLVSNNFISEHNSFSRYGNIEVSNTMKIMSIFMCLLLLVPAPVLAKSNTRSSPAAHKNPSDSNKLLHKAAEIGEHVAAHAAGHAIGHAVAGSAGAAAGGVAAGLLHTGTLGSEQETQHVNQQLDQLQQQRMKAKIKKG